MNEAEWGELRAALCTQFDEDVVQIVLLKLHKHYLKGGETPEGAIYWARKVAYHVKIDTIRASNRAASALVGRDFPSVTKPEQEMVFMEAEILDRLSKPINQRTGKPTSLKTVARRRQRLAKQELAA